MRVHRFIYILLGIFITFQPTLSQEVQFETKPRTFLLSGASFAAPVNGWFELACEQLGARAINRAKGGTAIADMANLMAEGALYSRDELEVIDALVIMHVVNRDVFDEEDLKPQYTDYETPFDRSNFAKAFDYVIKRYITECYNLRFDSDFKYYQSATGKPAVIILCTDWHDGRETYNTTVRLLASKWGITLVEFDKNIGFSKAQLHPVTGEQMSRLHSPDQQRLNGEIFGWHPHRGKDQYIQKRMSAIFVNAIQKIFP